MRLKLITAILTLLFVAAGCTTAPAVPEKNLTENSGLKKITVAEHELFVEVRDTDAERAEGLSYRTSLPAGQGMLFDFTNTALKRPAFWMKGMQFNIDIIWIKNNQVVGIEKNIPAPSAQNADKDLMHYLPPSDVEYALEVNAQWCDDNNITIGDRVSI